MGSVAIVRPTETAVVNAIPNDVPRHQMSMLSSGGKGFTKSGLQVVAAVVSKRRTRAPSRTAAATAATVASVDAVDCVTTFRKHHACPAGANTNDVGNAARTTTLPPSDRSQHVLHRPCTPSSSPPIVLHPCSPPPRRIPSVPSTTTANDPADVGVCASSPGASLPAMSGSLRSRRARPAPLQLTLTHGLTTYALADLGCRIRASREDPESTSIQIPQDHRSEWNIPATPTSPLVMGNRPSGIVASLTPENLAQRDPRYRRDSTAIKRNGPITLVKRINNRFDPRDPLPGTQFRYARPESARKRGAGTCSPRGRYALSPSNNLPDPDRPWPAQHVPNRPPSRSRSNATMTEERANRPFSATTTIRDHSSVRCRTSEEMNLDGATSDPTAARPDGDVSEHSPERPMPTLPAPSPLPEDSPHKYGLQDNAETPRPIDRANGNNAFRARRRSSGLEIFQEAKTLQSASSFLNGLSVSRRLTASAPAPCPENDTHLSQSPVQAYAQMAEISGNDGREADATDSLERDVRIKGNCFKPSGFAYSRPLTVVQAQCYRGHDRLLLSRNIHAPVECAICHVDSECDHWSCSWCALRMCTHCRSDFVRGGVGALSSRMKQAETSVVPSRISTDSGLALVDSVALGDRDDDQSTMCA